MFSEILLLLFYSNKVINKEKLVKGQSKKAICE